jgi:hypothetical protein
MLSVLKRLAAASPAALPPHWKDVVPSICAIVQVRGAAALQRCMAKRQAGPAPTGLRGRAHALPRRPQRKRAGAHALAAPSHRI